MDERLEPDGVSAPRSLTPSVPPPGNERVEVGPVAIMGGNFADKQGIARDQLEDLTVEVTSHQAVSSCLRPQFDRDRPIRNAS